MKKNEMIECTAIGEQVLTYLSQSVQVTSAKATEGATLRFLIGGLKATFAKKIDDGTMAASLRACFDAARAAGVDFLHMSRVRAQILTIAPVTQPAVLLVNLAVALALVAESKIIAVTKFKARDDVEALITRMQGEFDAAEETLADRSDNETYSAMVSLHAAVTNHLVATARPMPQIINYDVGASLPSLVLAQRLYGDPTRADELRAENHVIHPLFCPAQGRALSA